jgi:hypothetical protein
MSQLNETTQVLFKSVTDNFLSELQTQVTRSVLNNVNEQLSKIDIATVVREHVSNVLNSKTKTFGFPDRSVPGRAIDPEGLWIKADQIAGGTLRNFESTGIQDQATGTQLTILDQATVFENQLVTKELRVAGDAVIEGDLTLTGSISADSKLFKDISDATMAKVQQELTVGLLDNFQNHMMEHIKINGINSDYVKHQGIRIVRDGALAPGILNSNLQKVGALKELQVIGETLLDETVYVSQNRVGINTMDPESVLDVWDQEVQIVLGKLEKDYAIVGVPKAQRMVLSSNKQHNLVINPDGSVSVNVIKIGSIRHTSGNQVPDDDRPMGTIVWNAEPEVGSPIGWVSLGGARWAKFGTVTA